MNSLFRLLPRGLVVCWISFLATVALASSERSFSTPTTLSTEVRTFIQLLREVHYNRDVVRQGDYDKLIPSYMGDLDQQRMFLLDTDREEFTKRYSANWLYFNLANLGKLDPAYEIFTRYEERVKARVQWIDRELEREFDLSTLESYETDRLKAAWPASESEADDLWRRRLKFEILEELLNKKPVEEAKSTIRKRYERRLKYLADTDGNDISEMFLASVARMYDPHSTYFSADTFEDFNIQMRLKLVGIGALLGIEEDQCVVKEIIPGGPADISKLIKPNDKIISVGRAEGEELVEVGGMKLRKIVEMIRGAKGSPVRLLLQPADASDPSTRREVVLVRDVVKIDSARAYGAIFDVPDAEGNLSPIGVITLPAFYGSDGGGDSGPPESASQDVAKLIQQMEGAGITGLVLDLRRNGGGLLSEAINLTGLFITGGPVVQVRDYSGNVKVDVDRSPHVAYSGPLAVLVSRFSASASEIVAGALQNYGRAIIVGDSSTHGKGTVQTIVEMRSIIPQLARSPDKTGATKLTIQKFYLPNGASTQLQGVIPDITLPSIDDYLPMISERDLTNALVWDEIPSSFFEGKPLDRKVLTSLKESSQARQESLEEFSYLKKNIGFYRAKIESKSISLNLEQRQQQREDDDGFKKTMKAEKTRLSQQADYKFREFTLAPPPPPRPKAEKKSEESTDALDALDDEDIEDGLHYSKLDIHLRESLRILNDARALGRDRSLWTGEHAPLTLALKKER